MENCRLAGSLLFLEVLKMKVVHPVCAGLDVHKKEIVTTVAIAAKSNITTYKQRKFQTCTSNLNALADWLLAYDCRLVSMESTGKYYIPVYRMKAVDCSPMLRTQSFCGSQSYLFTVALLSCLSD